MDSCLGNFDGGTCQSCHVPLRLHLSCKASKVGPGFELVWKMGFLWLLRVLSFKS